MLTVAFVIFTLSVAFVTFMLTVAFFIWDSVET